jgi:hypothetical protein
MVEVKRIGSYLETDEQGYLVPVARATNISEDWRPAVEGLVQGYREAWGEALHSVYVRGSLVKGQAVAGYSDLDSFGVLREGTTVDVPEDWRDALENRIQQAFPFVVGVELDALRFDEALDRAGIYAFIIKVEAACVDGEDLAPLLEPYRITPDIAFQTQWFGHHLALFLREYPDEPEGEKPGYIVWLMRRFVRLGMELVMVEEGRFTRDLYLCYESFARHYPERAGEMYRALTLALNPETGMETEAFIREFGGWLEGEAMRKLASWGLSPAGSKV